jgi:hypothetical protein
MNTACSSETLLNNYCCFYVQNRPEDEGTGPPKRQELYTAVFIFNVTAFRVEMGAAGSS